MSGSAMESRSACRDTALHREDGIIVDLLYGDYDGGQRTITRFGLSPWPDRGSWRSEVIRYWNLDREDPR